MTPADSRVLLMLGISACSGGDATDGADGRRNACGEDYVDNLPPSEGVLDEIDAGGHEYCNLEQSVDEWCALNLPCWSQERCPPFEQFLDVIEWTTGSTAFTFTTGSVETYDPSLVVECSGDNGTIRVFRLRITSSGRYEFYFDDTELVAIRTRPAGAGPTAYLCGPDEATDVWWGAPMDAPDDCEILTREDFL